MKPPTSPDNTGCELARPIELVLLAGGWTRFTFLEVTVTGPLWVLKVEQQLNP
ncbi:hypothetical protein [Polaromonas sp. OV174]|uniref:hypothetical protein n=1 Tax=Polaromonas sp. OV174 TaxID=1855300 RepID=UPI0015A5DB58|nr:hypothetical protein [Polaromonas sp. OV174]